MEDNEEYSNQSSIFTKMLPFLFIIWFIASIVSLIVFSKIGNTKILLIIAGQYFFVFAMVFFSENNSSLFPLIHLTVGIILIVVPLVIEIWPRFTDIGKNELIDVSLPIVSIVLGYVFLILSRGKDESEFKKLYICSWIFYVFGIIRTIMFCL